MSDSKIAIIYVLLLPMFAMLSALALKLTTGSWTIEIVRQEADAIYEMTPQIIQTNCIIATILGFIGLTLFLWSKK